VPKHSYLSYFGRGITKKSAQYIQETKQALIVDLAFPREQALTANKAMANLINLTAQTLLEAPTAINGNTISLNIDTLKNLPFQQELLASLKENAKTKTEFEIKDAQWEEGDPDNYLIEILFSNAQGRSLSEQQENLLSHVYGWEDSISYVKHNSLILEASARAKKEIKQACQGF